MKTSEHIRNETEYTVRFTAEEVIKKLLEIVREKHPNAPDNPGVWGFDRQYRSIFIENGTLREKYHDITFVWKETNL